MKLNMIPAVTIGLCWLLPSVSSAKGPIDNLKLPGEAFEVAGRPAFVLLPEPARRKTPQPWILYAPTLPAYPDAGERWMHEHFLAAGVAVAGIDTGEAYGSPKGSEGMTALYREMVENRGFARRPCLLGRSRGGLAVTAWAGQHPDWTFGIVGIYPVFDLRTYPGLNKAAPVYGLKPEELESRLAEFNPIEQADEIATRMIPAYLIHGDADMVVPIGPNSEAFAKQYLKAGRGDLIRLVVAKGQGHNMWEGFFRSQELVDFAIARARAGS